MATILIIEDNAALRANLEDMLAMEGHSVRGAASGESGLELLMQERPDLVICDIMLPGMDGWAVLAALRSNPVTSAVPLIFLTAKGDAADVRAGMRLGADDYLPKPFQRVDLLDTVRMRLQRTAQQRRFTPSFASYAPLEALGLSPREAEVLLWMAQGKANSEIAVIVGCAAATVKKHSIHIFEKLGVEGRAGAMLHALEVLGRPS